ncbi:DUF3313 domain-containing protein [uncultured Pseudodesulfovibrio sp.]|uniref:DUF3313 domain-containing protein n=1 Tax=uncultured Pseudodesulfovibrio sp. TaxID=2035858 RepID=UPI0029C722BB|nr:DUF3313 domain-containing protein [uncultured Pseudodesulfovibrio sp.]
MKMSILLLAVTISFLTLMGCGASYHAHDMKLRTVLVNPAILQKGTGDEALYRYVNKDVDIHTYGKILLDPVMIAKDGEMDAETRENYQRLADNAYVLFSRELGKDYTLVTKAETGAMRLQMVILDADPSQPVRNVLASLTPIGMAMNLVTYSSTGEQSGVGDISMEMKASDSMTGKLMGAVVDRRVGGEHLESVVNTWSDANAGLEWWAKRTRFFLCMARSPVGCVAP